MIACCIWLGLNSYIRQCVRCNRPNDPQRGQNSIENENYIEMNVLPSTSTENSEPSFNVTTSHEVDPTLSSVAVIEVHTTTDNSCSTNDIDQSVGNSCTKPTDIGQSVYYRDGQIDFMSPTDEPKCLSAKDSATLNFDNIEYDNFLPN